MKNYSKYIVAALIISGSYYITNTAAQSVSLMEKTQTPRYKYLALGDSYTIGESVENSGRFPFQLYMRLLADSVDIAEPYIIAKTGWTTDELMNAIAERNVRDTFDIVTLLIGVNNQYRERSVEEYRVQFKQLLDTALSFAGGKKERVFVLSIPDWGVTPFAEGRDRKKIAREIDDYNFVNKSESMNAGVKYFDITDISRLADPMLTAGDGLHPSTAQYKLWVDRIYPDIKAAFAK